MGDIFQKDFRDFIKSLNKFNVSYIVVGGFSVIIYGHARVTGDMDIWVERTEANYELLQKAFQHFKMPVFDMTKENFLYSQEFDVFRFGRKPVRIDILTKVKGLNFEDCKELSVIYEERGLKINTLHLNHLIEAKKAAGRLKDLDDIEQLLKKRK